MLQDFDPTILSDFFTIFISIIVEAFPFVVLGIGVSILINKLNLDKIIFKILPKNNFLSHLVIALFGVFMPVCECGNIPVARELLKKKLSVSHVTTFLLAAPILNPITLWSTFAAFGEIDPKIVWYRMIGALVISVAVGLLFSVGKQKEFINKKFSQEDDCSTCGTDGCGNGNCNHSHENCEDGNCDHVHSHKHENCEDGNCDHDHGHSHNSFKSTLNHFTIEFSTVMKMLVIGALIASISQVFVPREVILAIGTNPFLSILAMLVLGFVISICSSVDAFFALSYVGVFNSGSLVAFLLFGPMIDIKILSMLRTTFTRKYLIHLTVSVTVLSILIGLMVNLF